MQPIFALLGLDLSLLKIYKLSNMTKLHIDITNGILEVEGEEEFVNKIYQDYKAELVSLKTTQISPKVIEKPLPDDKISSDTKSIKQSSTKGKSKGLKESYALIKDLDLNKGDRDASLKDYYKEKSPSSFVDKNVVFVFYLKKIASVPKVTLNHIYTCYEEVGSRKPSAFKQSIADTSSKKGYLDTASFEDIKVSIRGENLIKSLPLSVSEEK